MLKMEKDNMISNTQIRNAIREDGIINAIFNCKCEDFIDKDLAKAVKNAKRHLTKIYNILSQE